MFPTAFKIWFTAQLVFIGGLGLYSLLSNDIHFGERLQLGMIIFLFGLACSLPALLILWLLIEWLYRKSPLNTKGVLPAVLAAALAALITYSGWCAALGGGDIFKTFLSNAAFLVAVIACTTVATLLHYKCFQTIKMQS